MDKDANNEVSLEEFKATPRWQKEPEKAEGAFKKKDKDANGKLTLEEFSAKPEKPNKPNKPAKEGEPKKP
jgi:Ca2+-binding EF-hand superfamily protein